MFIHDDHRWGSLSEATVAAFEARNAFDLPADYRAFLLAHHGGIPDPDFYWVVPADWGSAINRLYGFAPDGPRLQEYWDDRDWLGISEDLLAIGDDGCGNYLCLGIAGPRRGHIVYVDHEFSPGEAGRELRAAESFAEFLSSLRPSPES